MNLKISPYVIGLVKENILYILLNICISILILFFLTSNTNRTIQNSEKIKSITGEVQTLERRAALFNRVAISSEDLESNIKLLNGLVPNTEDFFSVIYALEKLSQKTGFLITSYTINLKSSTQERLKLSITGTGNQTAFLKFLKDYNFGGGRLITSDKIELSSQASSQIKVDITFYNKKTSRSENQQALALTPQLLQELLTLKEKISFDLKSSSEEGQLDLNYPRKSNPF